MTKRVYIWESVEPVRDRIPERWVLLEPHIWRVTSVPQP